MRLQKTIVTVLWFSTTVITVTTASSGQTPEGAPSLNAGTGKDAVAHYEDGVAAAKRSQWSKAHESFLAAWKLKQHFQIAANLGRAELKLRKYDDAAEHLAYFLREAPDVDAAERKAAQAMFDQARARVGAVSIVVDRPGAEILVDGVAVGTAPIGREVFVKAGRRTIEAKLEGFEDDRRSVDIAAGSSPRLLLTLSPSASGRADESARRVDASLGGSRAAGAQEEAETGGLSMPLIGTGIAVSALAAGAGVALTVVSMSKANEIGDKCEGTDPLVCPAEVPALESVRYQTANAAVWSFIGAGVVASATAGYAIFGPSAKPESTSAIAVKVHPTIGGVVVSGTW